MSFWTKPATTTTLLVIIAALLLALVVQNSMHRSHPAPGMAFSSPPMENMPGHNHPPMTGANAGAPSMTTDNENFDPSAMILAALACPTNPSFTLADAGCEGSTANERRQVVQSEYAKNPSIRGVFDSLVKKYGEGALTAQALEIRRQRRTN